MKTNYIYTGDALEILRTLPGESVHCVVTSPPYWGLRDYGVDGQIGLEGTPQEFVERIVDVFREVRRVLRPDGTCWVNLGDSYANDGKWGGASSGKHVKALHGNTGIGRSKRNTGLKSKDLIGIPWRVAFALQEDGWYLRQDIIWSKPNPMPESVRDRCTKAHEYLFLFSKSRRYYFDREAICEPVVCGVASNQKVPDGWDQEKGAHGSFNRRYGGKKYTENPDRFFRTKSGQIYEPTGTRNKRSVWEIATYPCKAAHFATFPPKLAEPCILAGSPEGGVVLDPFMGSGTVAVVALNYHRKYVGIELNPEYVALARDRISREGEHTQCLFDQEAAV